MAVYGDSRAGRQNERHRMTIAEYAAFAGVTVAAVVVILRACYFLFVLKSDPVKACIPKAPKLNWFQQHEEDRAQAEIIQSVS